ncbi:MAG: 16S rRNA (guanine(527)-N(7))-methyltransferase RsmG [Lachnospiraceae bacterium]|nr:16S rRNA (guanine(527)-N(7))-methyltransferase RsmG [Lachnospiraceae bacterium]
MKQGYDTSQFEKDLNSLDVRLETKQIEQFLTYYEMLAEWNQKMNLTAITEYDEVMKKHFIDSISLVKAIDLRQKGLCMIDVGTGAGFPGLALKIAFPNLNVTLLDSLNKRIQFLNAVINELNLVSVEAVHGRAEDFASGKAKLREQYDLCVSRAVANLSTLSEFCLPFVKTGGKFISYKSEKLVEEASAAQKAITVLGGQIRSQVDFYLPDSDIYRNLFVIEKVRKTPEKYPRKAGTPAKDPIR